MADQPQPSPAQMRAWLHAVIDRLRPEALAALFHVMWWWVQPPERPEGS
jgi:hypothetical protein